MSVSVIYMSSNSIREVKFLQYDFSARREICVEECLPKSTFLAKIYEGRILHMSSLCGPGLRNQFQSQQSFISGVMRDNDSGGLPAEALHFIFAESSDWL